MALKPRPRNDHYMASLGVNDRSALDLRSVDSSMMSASDNAKARCHEHNANEFTPAPYYGDGEGEYRAMHRYGKRLNRGGSTFRPEDTEG